MNTTKTNIAEFLCNYNDEYDDGSGDDGSGDDGSYDDDDYSINDDEDDGDAVALHTYHQYHTCHHII